MITVDRAHLLTELQLLAPVVRGERVIPILQCVLLRVGDGRLTLVGSCADCTLTTTVACEGELLPICVLFAPLLAAVKLFDGEQVTIKAVDGRVHVACGKSRHKLPLHDASQYPTPDPVDGETLLMSAPQLAAAITAVQPCVDRKEGRYATRGVCLDASEGSLYVVAFDGVQMGVVKLMTTQAKFATTVIDDALPALLKVLATCDDCVVTVGANALKFDCGERQLTTRLLVGEFPRWRMVVPAESVHQVQIPIELAVAVKRCSVTASEGNLVRRRLKLEFTSSLLTVRSYGGDGESVEDVGIQCATLNGTPLVVKVNADQILAYLQSAESPTLTLNGPEAILLFTEGERRYLHATLRADK